MDREHRGLRLAESAPIAFVTARVTELSLRGCFLATSASFEIRNRVLLKICDSGEYFEAEASVLQVQSSGGDGVRRNRATLSKGFAEVGSDRTG